MARNRDDRSPVSARTRSGRFSDYDDLLTYYVGLGGNTNTTTLFRRYIGDHEQRPLLPENDLSALDSLLVANRKQHIKLIANENRIEYWRDRVRLFRVEDVEAYRPGGRCSRDTVASSKRTPESLSPPLNLSTVRLPYV